MCGKTQMDYTFTIVLEECYKCGVVFGFTEDFERHLRDNGDTFYCPNGHGQIYSTTRQQKLEEAQKEINRLKAQNQSLQESRDWWHDEAETKARSLSATKGVLTKTKKRIARGICPCCNRQFVNMQRHMETKHPEYIEESKQAE